MAIKIPWKSLSKGDSFFSKWGPVSTKWGTFSSKQLAFFAGAGLVVVAGLLLRAGLFSGDSEGEQKAPVTIEAPASPAGTAPAPSAATTPAPTAPTPAPSATAPAATPAAPVAAPSPPAQEATSNEQAGQPSEAAAPAEPAGETAEQTEPSNLPDTGTILVARRPVEVLSGPSSTASVMYGFPAGRQFRVISREGDFAQIKDVVSGASGWINEAALAPPPREPDVYAPSQSRPTGQTRTTADPRPKTTKRSGQASTGSEPAAEPAQPAKRGGLFGGGGPFRGIFGGGN